MVTLAAALCAGGTALIGGCASTPSGVTPGKQTLITFEVQVAGSINTANPASYYYIVLDTDNDPSDGPIPVVSRPWGNGYAAGSYTHYILYRPGSGFRVYRSADPNHTEAVYMGTPLQAGIATTNRPNDTLVVQVERSQIATVNTNVSALDVNVIATDRVPLDPQEITPKIVDGLGPSGNDFVTIPLTFTTTYANGVDPDPGHPETPNDAPGLATRPDLDLASWRITVQTNQ
jgi:hypothetical protein